MLILNLAGFWFRCHIRYKLIASLTRPDAARSKLKTKLNYDVEQVVNVGMAPIDTSSPGTTIIVQRFGRALAQSGEVSSKHSSGSNSLTGKLKAKLSSSNGPEVGFDVELTLPQRVHLGEQINFTARLRPDFTSQTAPLVTVKSIGIITSRHIFARSVTSTAENIERSYSEAMIKDVLTGGQVFQKGNDYTIHYHGRPLELASSSFKTYNIRQVYTVEVLLTAKFEKEEEVRSFQTHLLVLPPRSGGGELSEDGPAPMYQPTAELGAPMNSAPDYHHVAESEAIPNAAPVYRPADGVDEDLPAYVR